MIKSFVILMIMLVPEANVVLESLMGAWQEAYPDSVHEWQAQSWYQETAPRPLPLPLPS